MAQPVGRANATERQASASGSGLSAGGFAVDGFGLSWDFFDRGLCGCFLSVPIRAIRGFLLCAVAWPAVTTEPDRLGRRFLD